MAHHAFGAGSDLVGLLAKSILDRQRLHLVVDAGAGAVSVDVMNVRGTARVFCAQLNATGAAASGWVLMR